MAGYRRDLESMGASLSLIKNPLKKEKKPTKVLPEAEVVFKPSEREKVLMEANKAVNNETVSWRKSKGKLFGLNLGELKNKAKAKFGNKNFKETGECTDNTCVTAVSDIHKKANVKFSSTEDNRTLRKQLQSGELGYEQTATPQKGDIVQFTKTKLHKIRGTNIPNPFKKPIKNYPSHIGIVSDLNKQGRPTKYIGTSGTSDPNLKKGTHFKLKKGKETRIRKPETKSYYTLDPKGDN